MQSHAYSHNLQMTELYHDDKEKDSRKREKKKKKEFQTTGCFIPHTSLHAHNTHHHPFVQKVLVGITQKIKNWAFNKKKNESQKHEGRLFPLVHQDETK